MRQPGVHKMLYFVLFSKEKAFVEDSLTTLEEISYH